MKDTPFLFLGFKVERSTYFEVRKAVKAAKVTTSKYLRDILNDYLSSQNPGSGKQFSNKI